MAGLSGSTTGGYYSYIDSCGNAQQGFAFANVYVCVDQTYSASTVGIQVDSGSTCNLNCNQGPISYLYGVTGTCDNVSGGTVSAQVLGGIPPYTITNTQPGTIPVQTSSSLFSYTGLSASTYVFRINDSLAPQNNELYFNVNISECFETTIDDVSGTTCGDNDGSFYINATSTSSPYNIIIYKNGVYYSFYQTNTLPYLINGLSSGIYNAIVYDYGFTTANTENVVISASTPIEYGIWVVNTSTCVINTGKLAVTGLTGNGPFTIQWSDGQTGQLATGLTQGTYSVTVTDNNGCQKTEQTIVGAALPLGVVGSTSTNPTGCFSSDGSITVNISGGTGPYYYSANTNQIGYTLSDTFTLTNMPSGNYQVFIRDANFCSITINVSIGVPFGFTFVGNSIINSQCNQNSGSLTTTIQGANGSIFYSLSGLTNGLFYSQNLQSNTATFNNLSPDNYLLKISGQSSSCDYTDTVLIQSVDKFNVSINLTGSTCGNSNGKLLINVGTGYTNWETNGEIDYILSDGQSIINTQLTAFTFNNLSAGNYTLQVIDEDNCSVSRNFNIGTSSNLISTVIPNNCVNGNDGSAVVYIFEGEPTFTYDWSNNVPLGTTGDTATNLSGGNYSVLITDSSGCTNEQFFDIICNTNLVTNYVVYEICSSNFSTTTNTKRGISEMLSEGYLDLTTGYTNCILNNSIINCVITLNGSAFTETLLFASDQSWQTAIQTILDSIPEISNYNVNLFDNTLSIKSICNDGIDSLGEVDFKLELTIDYDISCQDILPSPTPTPTPTPTPSPTPTPTPTPTPGPTMFTWFNNNRFDYSSSDNTVTTDTGCSGDYFTTTSAITVGTILYYDSALTSPVVGTNLGPSGGGWGRGYLSNDCPIVGSRYVVQISGVTGYISSVYTT